MSPRRIATHDELCEALGIPFSAEQLRAITAPLEPSVIVAGAGSGKTTVMAARVVWLVGTGQVKPDEVLGLTFTRKAAAELGQRVAAALESAGVLSGADGEGIPVVMTYDSFAARLVAEFGLRIGIDMEPTMITGAARYRLASRAVNHTLEPLESVGRLQPASLAERVLALDAELQSHLVPLDDVRRFTIRARERFDAAPLYRGGMMKDVRQAVAALDERLELLGLVERYQELNGARAWWSSPTSCGAPWNWSAGSPTWGANCAHASRCCCWTNIKTPRPLRRSCCTPSSARFQAFRSPPSAIRIRRSTAGAVLRRATSWNFPGCSGGATARRPPAIPCR